MSTPTYFSNYPDIDYAFKINKAGQPVSCLIKDFFHLMKVRDDLYKYDTIYDNYYIKNAQRPDEIAYELYDDEQYYWIILQINDITDYWNQWPLHDNELEDYINLKYGTEEQADAVRFYETEPQYDDDNNVIYPGGIRVSEDFVYPSNLGISYQPPSAVTNRQYEWGLNDLKREIQVIQPKYIADFIRDFEIYARALPDVASEVSVSDVKY
jgi:hypothetical protein